MHLWPVDATGHDLHRVVMLTVGTYRLEATIMGEEHPVPATEGVVGERFPKRLE